MEALGERIFLDTDLSIHRNQSCTSCHSDAWGTTGPNPVINAAGAVYEYNTRDVKPTCPDLYTEAEALAADCWPAPEVAENIPAEGTARGVRSAVETDHI